MDAGTLLAEMEALGSEQTRKIYRRHGAVDPMFGVSYAELGKLKKRIKTDHPLARALWESGNHDARVLATMVADPEAADAKLLDAWARDLAEPGLADALGNFAARTPAAHEIAARWTVAMPAKWAKNGNAEWIATAGWALLAHLAGREEGSPDARWEPYLETIERDIHASANRVRYEMNSALIAIGARSDALAAKATAAARRIGKVEVDHGETGCKTPDAAAYIEKVRARRTRRK